MSVDMGKAYIISVSNYEYDDSFYHSAGSLPVYATTNKDTADEETRKMCLAWFEDKLTDDELSNYQIDSPLTDATITTLTGTKSIDRFLHLPSTEGGGEVYVARLERLYDAYVEAGLQEPYTVVEVVLHDPPKTPPKKKSSKLSSR